MNESAQPNAGLDPGLVTYAHIIYGLHALSVLIGVTGPATVIGSFVFGLPSIIAVIMNYVRQSEVRGTWLESHFRWQIRTFWFAFLWLVVAAVVSAPLVLVLGLGIFTFFLAALVVAIWIVYRVATGWLALRDRRTMYA
ncbi:MAG: DUF4870 family protein [Steroidobacteraceae bacterium]